MAVASSFNIGRKSALNRTATATLDLGVPPAGTWAIRVDDTRTA